MVSVIIPVYNVEKYLRKCLDSVIHQTYTDLEIILIDDGSNDQSGIICDEYADKDKRIQVYHEKNKGVSAARNKGIGCATGEWLLFVDSDDWIDSHLIEQCYHLFSQSSNIDICFFGFKEVSGEEKIDLSNNVDSIITINRQDFLNLQYRIFNRDRTAICNRDVIKLSSPWKFYKKDLLERHHIRFSENLVNGEDGVFNLYVYQYAKKGICLEQILYFYRKRSDSVTQKYTPTVEKDFYQLHKAYKQFVLTTNNVANFKEVFKERLIWSFSFCCILKYCHPDNPLNYRGRKKQFLQAFNENNNKQLRTVALKNFGIKKKILFYFIKKKNFAIVSLLCSLQKKLGN